MASTMSRLPLVREAGSIVYTAICDALATKTRHLTAALSTIGIAGSTKVGVDIAVLTAAHIRRALMMRAPTFSPSKSLADVNTPVDIDLMELWRTVSLDPDYEVIRWLREAPLLALSTR